MATLNRYKVVWTTGPGGAGLSVFYTLAADDVTTDLATFFNAIKGGIPTAVTWQIPSEGDQIDSSDGSLTGAWTGGTGATIAGTASGAYAAGTGMYVRWVTTTVRAGRRFRGRTFLCPISTALYDSTGTIDNTNLATLQTAATNLANTSKLVIWGRPLKNQPGTGMSSTVVGAVAVDKVTSLRGRRS